MSRHRLPVLAAATTLVLALTGCGSDEPAATPPPSGGPSTSAVTTPELDSIAVIGHSGATGAGTDPSEPGGAAPANSWATGDNPEVDSIYQRLLAEHPAMAGHNYNAAVNGTTVDDLEPQLQSVLEQATPLPDVVIIQTIDNDIRCDGTDADNYEPFGQALDQVLTKLDSAIPGVRVFLVSQWASVQAYTETISTIPAAVSENTGTGPCDLFDPTGKIRASGVTNLQGIVDDYWAQVVDACGRFPGCDTDGAALQGMRLGTADLSADHNHLTIPGQAKMAAIAWKAFPADIKSQP